MKNEVWWEPCPPAKPERKRGRDAKCVKSSFAKMRGIGPAVLQLILAVEIVPCGTLIKKTKGKYIMKSTIVCIRLTSAEMAALNYMAARESTGIENRSEFIRLLIMREWKKSEGLAKPRIREIATAFRNGRPNGQNS